MALEAKGRAGLIKELERLGKARARAAKAGDVQAFKKLEAQMTKTRAAFERMNQGLEISRLGMMGQMQVAMGAMGAIQSLGNEVKSGSVSLMGMANAVYALGAAIKAGMVSDPAELRVLADRVRAGEIRSCPHGRPVAVKLTKYELEKMFKRA